METPYTAFMRDLETEYRAVSGLENRSSYKIYYCQVKPAPILTLGINPGGNPDLVSSDGCTLLKKSKNGCEPTISAASESYYENDEHDVLDCCWQENIGLLRLLNPIFGGKEERIRSSVVKTNLAFQRSARKKDIDIEKAKILSRPYLQRIIGVVRPSLILLTGVSIGEFSELHASSSEVVVGEERDPKVKQVVFHAARAVLADGNETLVVRVAHASQFGWTYERYSVAERIRSLIDLD